jgi:hypothetical protein
MMTPKFLRAEAARFREMAEATDREASKQRLLGMAIDYESRANVAVEPQPAEPMADAEPDSASPEPASDEAVTIRAAKAVPGERRSRSPRTLSLSGTSGTQGT